MTIARFFQKPEPETKEEKAPIKTVSDASTQTDLGFFAAPDEKAQTKERVRQEKLTGLEREINLANDFFTSIDKTLRFLENLNQECKEQILLPDIVDNMGLAAAKFAALEQLYESMSQGRKDLSSTFTSAVRICNNYDKEDKARLLVEKILRNNERNKLRGYKDLIRASMQTAFNKQRIAVQADQEIEEVKIEQPKKACCLIS